MDNGLSIEESKVIAGIPRDALSNVLTFLPFRQVLAVSGTCSLFYDACLSAQTFGSLYSSQWSGEECSSLESHIRRIRFFKHVATSPTLSHVFPDMHGQSATRSDHLLRTCSLATAREFLAHEAEKLSLEESMLISAEEQALFRSFTPLEAFRTRFVEEKSLLELIPQATELSTPKVRRLPTVIPLGLYDKLGRHRRVLALRLAFQRSCPPEFSMCLVKLREHYAQLVQSKKPERAIDNAQARSMQSLASYLDQNMASNRLFSDGSANGKQKEPWSRSSRALQETFKSPRLRRRNPAFSPVAAAASSSMPDSENDQQVDTLDPSEGVSSDASHDLNPEMTDMFPARFLRSEQITNMCIVLEDIVRNHLLPFFDAEMQESTFSWLASTMTVISQKGTFSIAVEEAALMPE